MGFQSRRGFGVVIGGAPTPPSGDAVFNFRKDIGVGVALTNILTAKASQEAGVSINQAPATMTTTETAGVAVSTFSTGTVKPTQGAGVSVGPILTMINKPQPQTGIAITRISYDYVGTKWVATATSIGSDAWTNLANAQGAANGSSATRSGQLGTTNAEMRCQFQGIGLKEQLTLNKVELQFYVAQSGTLLNSGGLSLDYRIGASGGWTNLIIYADNQDFISAPRVFDMTSVVGTWANAKLLEARVAVNLGGLTGGVTCSVDAVKLHLEASLVDTL